MQLTVAFSVQRRRRFRLHWNRLSFRFCEVAFNPWTHLSSGSNVDDRTRKFLVAEARSPAPTLERVRRHPYDRPCPPPVLHRSTALKGTQRCLTCQPAQLDLPEEGWARAASYSSPSPRRHR